MKAEKKKGLILLNDNAVLKNATLFDCEVRVVGTGVRMEGSDFTHNSHWQFQKEK